MTAQAPRVPALRRAALLGAVSLSLAACDTGTADGGEGPEAEAEAPTWPEVRSSVAYDEDPEISEDERATLAADQLELALDLHRVLREDPKFAGENIVTAPMSIQTGMAMVYAGATGEVAEEIETYVHLNLGQERQHEALNWQTREIESRALEGSDNPDQPIDPLTIGIINQTWTHYPYEDQLIPEFLDTLARDYDAGVYLADFTDEETIPPELEAINAWVSFHTKGLIPELIHVIPKGSSLVAVNALYLKGPWDTAFEEHLTQAEDFTRLDGSTTPCQLMHNPGTYGRVGEGEGYVAASVHMRRSALELVVIVPDDFQSFEDGLDAATLGVLLEGMEMGSADLYLPRFELRAHTSLVQAFKALGMYAPFTMEFTGILEKGAGPIFEIMHEAVIKVDEAGMEAAAATAVILDDEVGGGPGDGELTVRADRPFFVVVYDRPTNTPLFFGRVLDPS